MNTDSLIADKIRTLFEAWSNNPNVKHYTPLTFMEYLLEQLAREQKPDKDELIYEICNTLGKSEDESVSVLADKIIAMFPLNEKREEQPEAKTPIDQKVSPEKLAERIAKKHVGLKYWDSWDNWKTEAVIKAMLEFTKYKSEEQKHDDDDLIYALQNCIDFFNGCSTKSGNNIYDIAIAARDGYLKDFPHLQPKGEEHPEANKYHFAREIIFNLRSCHAITEKVYLHWIEKLLNEESKPEELNSENT